MLPRKIKRQLVDMLCGGAVDLGFVLSSSLASFFSSSGISVCGPFLCVARQGSNTKMGRPLVAAAMSRSVCEDG